MDLWLEVYKNQRSCYEDPIYLKRVWTIYEQFVASKEEEAMAELVGLEVFRKPGTRDSIILSIYAYRSLLRSLATQPLKMEATPSTARPAFCQIDVTFTMPVSANESLKQQISRGEARDVGGTSDGGFGGRRGPKPTVWGAHELCCFRARCLRVNVFFDFPPKSKDQLDCLRVNLQTERSLHTRCFQHAMF